MVFKRIHLLTVVILAAALLVPAAAWSAKPVAQVYGERCSATKICQKAIYANMAYKRITFVSLSLACGGIGPTVSISLNRTGPIYRNGKFSIRGRSISTDRRRTIRGRVRIRGQLTKRRSISGSWTVSRVVPGCQIARKGRFYLPYQGILYR